MRSHRILHPAIGISSVLHGHVPISVPQLCSRGWRNGHGLGLRLRMCTHPALVLLVGKAGGSVSLRAAVVVARDGRLGRRGVTVVSSRRGGVRIGTPLIHREPSGAAQVPASTTTAMQGRKSSWGAATGRRKKLSAVAVYPRRRRHAGRGNEMRIASEERLDQPVTSAVCYQRCMMGRGEEWAWRS
jgi:hypothetical protein